MLLTPLQRIRLLEMTSPPEFRGDFLTVRIAHDLRQALAFGEQEQAEMDFRIEDGRAYWKPEANVAKEIPMGPKAVAMLADLLQRRSDSKQLTEDCLDLYELFVEGDAQ